VESRTLKREYPLLLVIMLTCLLMAWNLQFSRLEGWILLAGLAGLILWMVQLGTRKEPEDPLAWEFEAESPSDMPMRSAIFWLVIGLLVLPLSSHFLVQGALGIARFLHVSETIIGLTIVALGTSLPELAASLTSALRKEDDLAIGNVIGSNMFNILGVLGIAAVITPVNFDASILYQDLSVMFLFTILLFFMAYGIRGPGRISRLSGGLLLFLFILYQCMVWYTAVPA
jgi:cation:H+ antiporter